MKTIAELQALHAASTKAAEDLLAKADGENRTLSEDEQKQFDGHLAEAAKIQAQIDQRKKLGAAKDFQASQAVRQTEQLAPDLTHTVHGRPQPGAGGQQLRTVEVDGLTLSVPATVRRHRPLKAFKGPGGDALAYNFAMQCLATAGNHSAAQYARRWCDRQNLSPDSLAMGGGANGSAGFLIRPEYESAIIDLRNEYGVFRREALNVPMGSDTKYVPRRTSGLTAYFVAENPGSGITESEKNFDQVQIVCKTLATLTRYSMEVSEDIIINIGDDLAQEIAYAFAIKEDACGFLGDGTSTYGGIQGVITKINDGNHAASISTAATGHTGYSTLTLSDYEAVLAKLPLWAKRRGNAKWFCSNLAWESSMKPLAIAAGGNTVSNIVDGVPQERFLGYPVVLSETLNATAGAQTSTPLLLFGDLRTACMIGDRRGIAVDMSDQRYFEYNQFAIRGTQRFDAIAANVGDSSTAGAVILLKTPGS